MLDLLSYSQWGGIGAIAAILSFFLALFVVIWQMRQNRNRHVEIIPAQPEILTLADRFLSVFKAHEIEHVQIPRYIQQLSLAELTGNEKLITSLDEKIIVDMCEKFNIQQDWLDGKSEQIYSWLFFDKQLEEYIDFLVQLKKDHGTIKGFAIKCLEDKLLKVSRDYDIALLFRGNIEGWSQSGGEPIWRYYPLHDYNFWGYERTRIQLKAMIAIAHLFKIHIHGCKMTQEEIGNLRKGNIFPGPLLKNRSRVAWHPDEYVFCEIDSFKPHDKQEAIRVRNLIESDWAEYLSQSEGIDKRLLAQIYGTAKSTEIPN